MTSGYHLILKRPEPPVSDASWRQEGCSDDVLETHLAYLDALAVVPTLSDKPPSTGNVTPVIYLASSEARNKAA